MNRYIIFFILLLLGCEIHNDTETGTESGNPPVIEKPTIGTPSLKALPSIGEPDSPSGQELPCENDEECVERHDAYWLDSLERWGQPTDEYRTYESSYCGLADCDSEGIFHFGGDEGEPSCLCVDENRPYAGDRGDLLTPLVQSDCLIRGRFNSCLYYKDEFTGCDLEKATESCKSFCDDLEARNYRDAKWDTHVESRLTKCLELPELEAMTCHEVIEVEGDCYAFTGVLFGKVNNPLDCSLTDDELLNDLEKDLSLDRPKNTLVPIIWDESDEATVETYDGDGW